MGVRAAYTTLALLAAASVLAYSLPKPAGPRPELAESAARPFASFGDGWLTYVLAVVTLAAMVIGRTCFSPRALPGETLTVFTYAWAEFERSAQAAMETLLLGPAGRVLRYLHQELDVVAALLQPVDHQVYRLMRVQAT